MTPPTYASVNMTALRKNIATIKNYTAEAKIMAVIKADAYGHGLLQISEALVDVDAIAVARVEEGISLRKLGNTNIINILNGFVCKRELEGLAEYNLDFVVHSHDQVRIIDDYFGKKKLSVWLKLDTGMNRLGFKENDFPSVLQKLSTHSWINQPVSLMTHLSSADDVGSPVTLQQIKRFNKSVKKFSGEKSIANSAGIIAWPDAIANWVRPGIMLYGVSPFNKRQARELGLKPVMTLHSQLISVKQLAVNESVGYGCSWVSKRPTRLGVVAIGYGDGYPRSAKTGTPVLVNGKKTPLIGRVSMDMITVDLTDHKDAKPGDPVTLWGDGLAIEEIAKYANTIPYTLLCGITQRVERFYV